ncbi:hypothetical protein MRB53_031824 [Persea americana]|uniref:Uncharacterized protein n=1 Tax=Persea americana TaxID=3435 RepID=A0ACC2KQ66_PERAE|nr:hypothetical protein MRB53_031824 [Persea americana]
MAKANITAAVKPKPTKLPSSLHPPYLRMISEAISSLKERTGSSQQAIAKFIEEKYKTDLPPTFKKVLSIQLKKFAKSEKLVKVKNSFKLPVSEKVKKLALDVKEKKQKKENVKSVAGVKEGAKKERKMRRLSQVKTPSALKKKKKISTPKRVPKTINSPKRTVKKSRVRA